MSSRPIGDPTEGPIRPSQLDEDDRYELDHGHPLYVAPGGGDTAAATLLGGQVLGSDPDAEEAGIDPGYEFGDRNLRAPDVAVGNVPDRPGWVRGVPALAVEYAGRGQDEQELAHKIAQFLTAGTRWVWVVRLLGVRRVEVHEKGLKPRFCTVGEELTAPGVLRNPVKVESLFNREAAHEANLRNLLQRRGYDSLEAVREEGREAGREEGREEGREVALRAALLKIIERRGLALDEPARALIDACTDSAVLERWLDDALAAVDRFSPG